MSANTTGPAELRLLIENYDAMMGGPSATSELMKRCAAAWEADIARAERAEAALERARALAAKWRSQFEVRAGECVTGYPDCWAYADELRDALSAPDGAR